MAFYRRNKRKDATAINIDMMDYLSSVHVQTRLHLSIEDMSSLFRKQKVIFKKVYGRKIIKQKGLAFKIQSLYEQFVDFLKAFLMAYT